MTAEDPAPDRSAGREAWAALRAELDAAGFRPSRRLGQNFLLDENLLRAIVRDAEVAADERVLEVGVGLGFLTRHLLAAGARVVAVEVDGRLAELALRGGLAPWADEPARLQLVRTDVLAGKHRLAPEVLAALPAAGEGPWKLVANLPYGVCAPLLVLLCELEHPPAVQVALVQLEVAERVVARPGTPDWGPLSIRLQAACRARTTRRVPPELFWPRPKVDSAVVRLDLRPDRPVGARARALSGWVDIFFQRRRKALGGVLADALGDRGAAEARLAELGLDPRTRAETLPLESLLALTDALGPPPGPPGTPGKAGRGAARGR